MSPAGIKNYQQAIMNFIEVITAHVDPKEYKINKFHDKISTLKATFNISKHGIRRSILDEKRAATFEASIKPKEIDFGFIKIFDDQYFKDSKAKVEQLLQKGKDISEDCGVAIMRICVSLIVIKNGQRPSVAASLALDEYEKQKEQSFIFVQEHKTKSSRPAFFPFNEEEKYWFNIYYEHVRCKW